MPISHRCCSICTNGDTTIFPHLPGSLFLRLQPSNRRERYWRSSVLLKTEKLQRMAKSFLHCLRILALPTCFLPERKTTGLRSHVISRHYSMSGILWDMLTEV